jgi:uncharacterized protein YbjT (DUF2867 family)
MFMKVLVAGANGHTGRHIIEQLAEGGHQGFAMIRDPEQAGTLTSLGAADIVIADLEKNLSEAVKGMDAIIFAAGSGSKTGPEKTIAVDQEGAKRLIDAGKEERIKQFVMLSSVGADQPRGPIQQYLEAKHEADEHLKSSGIPYTIIRPGSLSFDEPTGKIELSSHFESTKGRSIPRKDVAHTIVASLNHEKTLNKTFEILSGDVEIEKAVDRL